MEKQKRYRFSADYKAKVVIEALKERNTIEQLAAKYELHPNQITAWKREFLSNASLAFSADSGKPKEKDSETDKLYAQIGQLTVENHWLKKVELKSLAEKRAMVHRDSKLSIRQQCILLSLCSSGIYYTPSSESALNLEIMRHMDEMAIIDIHTRYVLHWSISNTLTAHWIREEVLEAIARYGYPETINSDQGSQSTSDEYTSLFTPEHFPTRISMDGKGRCIDNIFIERLWRSVKYECVYLHAFVDSVQLFEGLEEYFRFYNTERGHQSLGYKKPFDLYTKAA